MAIVKLNILKCNFAVSIVNGELKTTQIEQIKIYQNADTTIGYIDINADNYVNYTPLKGYEVNRYNFLEDLEGNYHKEEKVIAFFYIRNTDVSDLLIRNNSYANFLKGLTTDNISFKNNSVNNIKKASFKIYLKEKEKEIKTTYKINPYNYPEKGEDPFNMTIKYLDIDGEEITSELLDIEQQKVNARFNFAYKEIVNQINIEFIDNKAIEDLYFANIDRDMFKIGKTIEFNNMYFPKGVRNYKIIESKIETTGGLIKRNLVLERETGFYVFVPVEFTNNPLVLNKNCKDITITEKINEDTKEIERNLIFNTNIEDLSNYIFTNTFPLPGDYLYILNPDITDGEALKQEINTISWELQENVSEVNFNLNEQLLNYSRQLKRNIINVAKRKDKEDAQKNEDYNRKKMDSISAKTDKKMRDLEVEYNKVIEEKRAQVRKDERAIIQLANFIEKVLTNINEVNRIIVSNHNKLIAKVDKDMPLVSPNAFKVDPSYPSLAPPENLTDDQLQNYIRKIYGGTYINPWK